MDKTELARKIQDLDGLNNEEKAALLELIRGHKKYGLVWEEKPEDIEERLREDLPVLIEHNDDKVHPIISDNPEAPNHLIIEGDNLAALTELSYTHAGKVDVIYIDPPYNTGNKDFVYNDSYIDLEDDFKHSTWLAFMHKRLNIVKTLLSPKGVIFISIDDNEYANLKLLCDEVFLEKNHVATFIIIRSEGGGLAKQAVIGHDYLLAYAAQIDKFTPLKRDKDVRGKIVEKDGERYWIETDWLRMEFGKYGTCMYEDIVTYHSQAKKDEIDEGLASGSYVLIPKGDKHIVGRLRNLAEDGSKLYTIQKYLNKDGLNLMREIGLHNLFSYPKPVALIREFIYGATFLRKDKKAVILDFFAGSGTTLHAVMELNNRDKGKRTCILCTNNENGICENVTYERNKRVIEGYTKPNGDEVAGLTDNNLRYYRTEFLPRERTVKNMRELVQASTGLLCIKNDLYTEAPFGGRKMNPKYARYFEHGNKRMLVIYEERAIPFIADIIKTMPDGEKIKVYVFSHSSYAYDDEFAEVEDRVELCALPQAIYDAYQKVLPKHKPKFLVDELVEEIEETEATEAQATLDFGEEENEKGGEE